MVNFQTSKQDQTVQAYSQPSMRRKPDDYVITQTSLCNQVNDITKSVTKVNRYNSAPSCITEGPI